MPPGVDLSLQVAFQKRRRKSIINDLRGIITNIATLIPFIGMVLYMRPSGEEDGHCPPTIGSPLAPADSQSMVCQEELIRAVQTAFQNDPSVTALRRPFAIELSTGIGSHPYVMWGPGQLHKFSQGSSIHMATACSMWPRIS